MSSDVSSVSLDTPTRRDVRQISRILAKAHLFSVPYSCGTRQCLREAVGDHLGCRLVSEVDFVRVYEVADEMIVDADVFRPLVEFWVLGQGYACLIVTVQQGWIIEGWIESEIVQELG